MRTVLVTVDTPYDSVDVDLPADIPLRDLLPELLGVLAIPPGALGADATQLALGVDGRPPFQLDRSLVDYQTVDGMRLRLDRIAAWSAPQRPTAASGAAGSPTMPPPSAPPATGGITVRWRRESFGPGQT